MSQQIVPSARVNCFGTDIHLLIVSSTSTNITLKIAESMLRQTIPQNLCNIQTVNLSITAKF